MDTAVVVVREAQAAEVKDFLAQLCPSQSDPWLVNVAGRPAIFINLAPAHEADLEPEDLIELNDKLNSDKLLAVLADVAVRNVGCGELRTLVATLLERFDGLASDDLLEHWWTADELKNPALVGGRIFWPHDVRAERQEGDA
jgi:hypothetical protein